ncbi:MAG: response regulator [Rhodomicrobium sp.]|jgi:two-component system cell cycle sensor histidine kinase/response regulator CckA
MPFAHWSPQWNSVAVGLGAIAALALAAVGRGEIALALLAFLGAGGAILFAAGRLCFKAAEGKSEERFSQLMRVLPTPVAVTSKKGSIKWGSETFLNTVGGLGLDQDLSRLGERHPETAAAIFRLFAAGRAGKSHAEAIRMPNFPAGDPIVLSVAPLVEHGSRSSLLIWQIEQQRKTAPGEKPRHGLDALPVPALSVSRDLSVQGANKGFEKLAGCSPAGKQAWSLFRTRRGNPLTRARLRDMIAKGGSAVPIQIQSASGYSRAASLHVGADMDEAQIWLVTPADPAAGSLDETFEALLSRAPAAMAFTNAKGVVQAANDAFRRLFGDPSEEDPAGADLCGKPLASLVAETSSQNVKDKIASLSASGLAGAEPVELQAALKGSLNRRARLTVFPAANDTSLIVQAVETGSAPIIDEQAVQGQKLQAVGELAGGIAHDFNNLLTAIIGFSDLLLSRYKASDHAFKDLMNIKNNATRAAELVKQILAYSRRQTLRPALLKITDVIEEFQATMGRTLGENVKAKVQHGRDLWFVKADEGQLFQVIMNLAVNARDAMPDGGEIAITTANVSERESLSLKDRGLDRGEYVMCEVRDSGTGIKPEHLEKIFDPFFSTKEVGKGTGLGLSTVFGIVKQTGGTIVVDSEIGQGTSFRIYLPRHVETEQELKDREIKPEPPGKPIDLTAPVDPNNPTESKNTVLLVEDEDTVRSFASRALTSRGYKVLEASSGVEALEIMDREHGKVDLVLSDVVMPEMDGPTLLRHLRQRNPNIRIVFMSGYAEEAFRKNLSADENFVFLPKPFTLKKLAETVKAAAA